MTSPSIEPRASSRTRTRTRTRTTAYGFVALAAIAWGTWPLLLRRAESYGPLPAAVESAVVMAIITAVTVPLGVRYRVDAKARASDWALMAVLGVSDALNLLLLFASYRTTSVAVAVLTHYLTPILVAVTAPLLLRERATPRTSLAVAVAFGGLVLLLEPWASAATGRPLLGAALGAGSAVFYTSNVLLQKRLGRVFSASELFGFHGLVSVPILVAASPIAAWSSFDSRALGVLTLGALGPGVLAGLAFVWGLRHIPASHASTLTLLEPFVAVILAALVLGEPLRPLSAVGGAAILVGALLVVFDRRVLAFAPENAGGGEVTPPSTD